MLKQYIRENKKPIGLVVEDNGYFGWSLCDNCDHWNKKLANKIALGRLKKNMMNSDEVVIDILLNREYFGKKESRISKVLEVVKYIVKHRSKK